MFFIAEDTVNIIYNAEVTYICNNTKLKALQRNINTHNVQLPKSMIYVKSNAVYFIMQVF